MGTTIKNISIIGAGLMGHGIAQEFALAGYAVALHDLEEDTLRKALLNIDRNIERLAGLGLGSLEDRALARKNIRTSANLDEVLAEADLVIEAVSENLEVKQRLFEEMDKKCPARAILASNTSTLLPGKLASVTDRPDKVLVTHYFNPPYLVPLVEIVRHENVSDRTVEIVFEVMKNLGKEPVIVQKEALGFVANRLQIALMREAFSIVEKGIADPEVVDTVLKTSIGRRWAAAGVFEIMDLAGWDVLFQVASNLLPDIASSREVPALLKDLVERGDLGAKTGRGIYRYTPESAEKLRGKIGRALVALEKISRDK